jgi:hypothetical protein
MEERLDASNSINKSKRLRISVRSRHYDSYQGLLLRIEAKHQCMRSCDRISKSGFSKAEKRDRYNKQYAIRDKQLKRIG